MRGDASRLDRPIARLVLAMALHQEGQLAEARKTLAAAILSYDWRATQARDPDGLDLPCAPSRGRGPGPPEPAGLPARRVPTPGQ